MDIAHQNQCSIEVIKKIEEAFESIMDSHFVRKECIDKLTKRSRNMGLTAYVYRVLSAETGEGWYVRIADRKDNTYCQTVIGDETQYVDRLGSRLYEKAKWCGNTFVIQERFGKEVFRISVNSL